MQISLWGVIAKKNYAGQYRLGNTTIPCYTRAQFKHLYPRQGYTVLGEVAPGSRSEPIATLTHDAAEYAVHPYRSSSRLAYAEQGLVAVDAGEDQYVALLHKSTLPRLALLSVALLAALGISLTWPGGARAPQTVLPPSEPTLAASAAPTPAVSEPTAQGRQLELEQGAVPWEGVQPRDTGGVTQGIAIPGYKSITIDANQVDVAVNLLNPEGNPCYFVISLLLDDGTILYQSKMISPGMGLYDITLSQPLAPGEYPATLRYETYSLEGQRPLNGAQVKITLIARID